MAAHCPDFQMNDEELQRRSAGFWLVLLVGAAIAVVAAAWRHGLALGMAWSSALATFTIFLGLGAGYLRYRARPSDRRLGTALGTLLSIFLAGSAGGVVSILGQTFAYPLIDARLAAADRLLGFSSIDVVSAIVHWPGLPTLLGLAYIATIPLIIVSVVALSLMGREDRAWELCAAFSFCMLVATLGSLFFPAIAAFAYLKIPPDLQAALPDRAGVYHLAELFSLRAAHHFQIDFAHLQGVVTFPSFHAAMAAMTAAAWRDDRRLRWPMLLFNMFVILSAIPIGGHYLVDLPAGILCWAAFFWFGPKLAAFKPARLAPLVLILKRPKGKSPAPSAV